MAALLAVAEGVVAEVQADEYSFIGEGFGSILIV